MKYLFNLLVLIILVIHHACSSRQYPKMADILEKDSLYLNLHLLQKQVNKYYRSPLVMKVKKLHLVNAAKGENWMGLGVHEREGEEVFHLMDIESNFDKIDVFPFLKGIENFRQLKKLSLHAIGISDLPEEITQLTELEVLIVNYNPISWERNIHKVKALPHLKLLEAYGSNMHKSIYNHLKKGNKNLTILYTTSHLKEKYKSK